MKEAERKVGECERRDRDAGFKEVESKRGAKGSKEERRNCIERKNR